MVLHYFNKKENKDKIIARRIYKDIIANVKFTLNKKNLLMLGVMLQVLGMEIKKNLKKQKAMAFLNQIKLIKF